MKQEDAKKEAQRILHAPEAQQLLALLSRGGGQTLQQALQRKHPVALKVAAPCGALILAGPMAGIETNFHAALLLSCCVPK